MSAPEKITFQLPQFIHLNEFDVFLKEEIGSGGFGSVYLAEYERENYAVKIYRLWEVMPNERKNILQRIYQEYKISEKIDSPHVAKIFSYQEIYGNPLLIMEFCEGGSLRDIIGDRLTHQALSKIVKDICKGLSAMHQQGIVHRDIKPENILLKEQNYCLTDFGISVSLQNRLTQTDIRGRVKQVFATAAYSPPEQANGAIAYKNTGPTNDIYAFGVVLYELLTQGALPFGSFDIYKSDPIKYEAKKKNEDWDRQLLEARKVDPVWREIIQKCLKLNPSERFQSADEIPQLISEDKNMKDSFDPILNLHRTMNSNNWQLKILDGDQKGFTFFISKLSKIKNKNKLTIGRLESGYHNSNDILIDNKFVSRHHATLEKFTDREGREQWYLRDGQWIKDGDQMSWITSTNGTFVNDKPIGQNGGLLAEGDVIKIGKALLKAQNPPIF